MNTLTAFSFKNRRNKSTEFCVCKCFRPAHTSWPQSKVFQRITPRFAEVRWEIWVELGNYFKKNYFSWRTLRAGHRQRRLLRVHETTLTYNNLYFLLRRFDVMSSSRTTTPRFPNDFSLNLTLMGSISATPSGTSCTHIRKRRIVFRFQVCKGNVTRWFAAWQSRSLSRHQHVIFCILKSALPIFTHGDLIPTQSTQNWEKDPSIP